MKNILCSVVVLAGCAAGDDGALSEIAQHETAANGISLNGISLNGISLNGISLNGISLNGISLNGTTLTGAAISATSSSGPPLAGSAVTGSSWTGTAANGETVKLRIDSASQGAAPNADLWFYAVSYQTANGWQPLCGLDADNQPILAVTVAGVWRAIDGDDANYATTTGQFTFACRGKTVAKCVEMGYKPYKGRTTQLKTCVRLLRGDFCGTGTAWTVDGTTLNLYDSIGVQKDTQAWAPEAEWTPDGARCVNSNNNARYELVLEYDPRCIRRIKSSTCGQGFSDGAVLIDELPESHSWDPATQDDNQNYYWSQWEQSHNWSGSSGGYSSGYSSNSYQSSRSGTSSWSR